MQYPFPDHAPAEQPITPTRPELGWPWIVLALAIVVALSIVALSLSGDDDGSVFGAPEPITRAELMERYQMIAPLDKSATPAVVDEAAAKVCRLLREGHTTDELISTVTDLYGPRATDFVQLIVEYECPEFAGSFR